MANGRSGGERGSVAFGEKLLALLDTAPDRVLEPYDLALTDVPTAGRRAWAAKVVAALEDELGGVIGHAFEIHAGAAYTDHGLARGLSEKGARRSRYRQPG